MAEHSNTEELARSARLRREIEEQITRRFAAEDDVLRQTLAAQHEAGLPDIQISPIQGRLLQVLVAANQTKKILEIGALGGYSGTWLARALPANGKLITLEISPRHAEVVRAAFARAGLTDPPRCALARRTNSCPPFKAKRRLISSSLMPTKMATQPISIGRSSWRAPAASSSPIITCALAGHSRRSQRATMQTWPLITSALPLTPGCARSCSPSMRTGWMVLRSQLCCPDVTILKRELL
jgi:hypothetical protein